MAFCCGVDDIVYQFDQYGVVFCVAAGERRGEECKSLVATFVHQVFVVYYKAFGGVKCSQSL